MMNLRKIKRTLGRSYNVNGKDVLSVKSGLNKIGYYQIPSHGLSQYPDTRLFDGIERFQKDHNLKVDGVMKPGGQTERTLLAKLGLEQNVNDLINVDTVAVENSVVASRYAVMMEAVVMGKDPEPEE